MLRTLVRLNWVTAISRCSASSASRMPWDSRWPICSHHWRHARAPLLLSQGDPFLETILLYWPNFLLSSLKMGRCPLVCGWSSCLPPWPSPLRCSPVWGDAVGQARLGYPRWVLSLWGAYSGGVVAANASSRTSSAKTAVSLLVCGGALGHTRPVRALTAGPSGRT